MPCASRSNTTVSHQLPTQLQEAERERGDGCIWFHAGPIYRRLLQHCCRPDVIRLQEIVLPQGLMERTEVTLSPSLFCLYASTFKPRICFLFGFFLNSCCIHCTIFNILELIGLAVFFWPVSRRVFFKEQSWRFQMKTCKILLPLKGELVQNVLQIKVSLFTCKAAGFVQIPPTGQTWPDQSASFEGKEAGAAAKEQSKYE